jgi:hypothetical protein
VRRRRRAALVQCQHLLVDHSLFHLLLDAVDLGGAFGPQRHLPFLLRCEELHLLRFLLRILRLLLCLLRQQPLVFCLRSVRALLLRFEARLFHGASLLRGFLSLQLGQQSLLLLVNLHGDVRLPHFLQLRHLHRLRLLRAHLDRFLLLLLLLKALRQIL